MIRITNLSYSCLINTVVKVLAMVQACLHEQCGITNTFTNSLLVFLLIPLQVSPYKRSILNVISVQLMNAFIKSQLRLIGHFENSYHAVLLGVYLHKGNLEIMSFMVGSDQPLKRHFHKCCKIKSFVYYNTIYHYGSEHSVDLCK